VTVAALALAALALAAPRLAAADGPLVDLLRAGGLRLRPETLPAN
jgi:hypothetical protein